MKEIRKREYKGPLHDHLELTEWSYARITIKVSSVEKKRIKGILDEIDESIRETNNTLSNVDIVKWEE